MDQEYYVYGLTCPLTNQLHYIGSTGNPVSRLTGHIYEACGGTKNKKQQWVKSLRDKNLKPEMLIIETTDHANRLECESFWIDYFIMVGADLFNILGVFKNFKTQKFTRPSNKITIKPERKMVKPLREKMGLTQGQFAHQIKTTKKVIDMWESDKFYIGSDETIKLFIKLHKRHMED